MGAVASFQAGGEDQQERNPVRRPGWQKQVLEGAAWNRQGADSPFQKPESRAGGCRWTPGAGRPAGWEKGSFLSCDDALSPERSAAGSGVKSTQ